MSQPKYEGSPYKEAGVRARPEGNRHRRRAEPSPIHEGRHSFGCWDAGVKLHEYRALVGHRLDAPGMGHARGELARLERDQLEEMAVCDLCSPPENSLTVCDRNMLVLRPARRKRKKQKQGRQRTMATATKNKISAAQAFRDSLKQKGLKTDDAVIAFVRKQSGSTTFDAKILAWYRSMHKAGKLSLKGRAQAKSN